MTEMQAVLSLAERAFGLSLTPADLSQPMRCARIVPPLEDPAQPPAADRRFGAVDPANDQYRTGDSVIDALMSHADPQTLAAIVTTRIRRLMTETGLADHPELVAELDAAVSGETPGPGNSARADVTFRRVERDRTRAEYDLRTKVNRGTLPTPDAELHRRVRAGETAKLIRLVLNGHPPSQVLASELQYQRVWDCGWQEPLSWRPQLIADFSGVDVPPAELRAAEDAWLADPEPVRGRVGLIDPEPVRAHVIALIAAGMDPEHIARLGDTSTIYFNDILLPGKPVQVSVHTARKLLTIPLPGIPQPQNPAEPG